jgi:nitrous oxidase accessory protein
MRKSALVLFWLLLIGLMVSLFRVSLVKTASNTIIVPDDYSTIQEAINHADEGDTIFLSEGTYYENVVVNKSVSLLSDGRTGIINGSIPLEPALTIEADNVFISELRVKGGGVFLDTSSNCIVKDNHIGTGYGSGGIDVYRGTHNMIAGNFIEPCTGGIKLIQSDNNTVTRNSMNPHEHSLFLSNSSFNLISENELGIHWSTTCLLLLSSHSNTIVGNTLLDEGFEFSPHMEFYGSNDNLLFHNNFEGLSCGVDLYENNTGNVWDNGVEGNYWCDYTGTDTDGDGVGDTGLPWKGLDYHPLMTPYFYAWRADIDDDLDVDIFDVVTAATAYGSTPSDPNWNPDCDIAEPYGIIDIFDIVKIAMDYGAAYHRF